MGEGQGEVINGHILDNISSCVAISSKKIYLSVIDCMLAYTGLEESPNSIICISVDLDCGMT